MARARMVKSSKRTLRIILGGFFVISVVWQNVQATKLGYEVEKTRRLLNALKGRTASSAIELQRSLTPAQLAFKARTKLGMFPALPESLRILGS